MRLAVTQGARLHAVCSESRHHDGWAPNGSVNSRPQGYEDVALVVGVFVYSRLFAARLASRGLARIGHEREIIVNVVCDADGTLNKAEGHRK